LPAQKVIKDIVKIVQVITEAQS